MSHDRFLLYLILNALGLLTNDVQLLREELREHGDHLDLSGLNAAADRIDEIANETRNTP